MSPWMQANWNVQQKCEVKKKRIGKSTTPNPNIRFIVIAHSTRHYVFHFWIAQYVRKKKNMIGIAGDIIYHIRYVMATGEIFVWTVSIFHSQLMRGEWAGIVAEKQELMKNKQISWRYNRKSSKLLEPNFKLVCSWHFFHHLV